MGILDDLMSILNFDALVKDIRQGVFYTGVLTRGCGLALRCVSEGANFRQIKGTRRLTMIR